MPAPTTADEWWALCDKYWEKLQNIVMQFAPKSLEALNKAKEIKDGITLVRYFNDAWWNAPDSPRIHEIPGWGVLCDLCSEEHCILEGVD